MRGFYQVQQIYDAQIKDVTTSPDKWMDMLKWQVSYTVLSLITFF